MTQEEAVWKNEDGLRELFFIQTFEILNDRIEISASSVA